MSKEKKCVGNCIPFVPSSKDAVRRALETADLKPGEVLLEPGCGDGQNLKIAAAEFGAVAIGYELDPELVKKARENTQGLNVRVVYDSFLNSAADIAIADVVYMYLLPKANEEFRPLLEFYLKPDARVISNTFSIQGWEPSVVAGKMLFYFSHPQSHAHAHAQHARRSLGAGTTTKTYKAGTLYISKRAQRKLFG